MGDRSRNFSNHEFRCNCHWKAPQLGACDQIFPPDELIVVMQDVRDYFGAPVEVNSGHRCEPYNALVKGRPSSLHLKAFAGDFTVKGVSPNEVQEYLLKRYSDKYGIGRYNTFTHVDVRNYKARWDYRR